MHARRPIAVLTLICALTAMLALAASPAAAAGEVIVYETYGVYGGPADIHSVNPDGTGDVNLTPNTDGSMELDPSVSADGTRIAFVSNRVTDENPDGNFEVFTMGIDGSGVTQVTHAADPFGQNDYWAFNPTWAPDGSEIAFDGSRASYSASQIFAIKPDGTGERQVTSSADQANKWLPDWSPDGSKILFTWGWDYYSQDIRTINPDGTGETNLTPETVNSAQGSGVWSPDGRRIAFSADGTLAGQYPNPNREIFVMEYPSGVITQVTEHSATDEDPAWSADGTEITFTSPRDGRYALYVIVAPPPPGAAPAAFRTSSTAETSAQAAESPVRKLDPGTGHEADPFWSVASGSGGGGTTQTLTVTRTGTGAGRVTSSPAGITCGTDCTQAYTTGTTVTLSATVASGSTFAGWSGACTGTGSCIVSMTVAKTVTATFNKTTTGGGGGTYALTVTKKGRGKVTSSPAGISCGKDCTESYASGTSVTLTAAPNRGYKLSAWSGTCTGSATTCTVTMTAAKSVTATFVRA